MNKEIKVHFRVEGGRFLTAKNAHRITAVSTRPTDRWGNRLPSPMHEHRTDPPYYQTWRIKKEDKGYIFREVSHGGGICGCHKTVRQLVLATLCCGLFGPREDIRVTIEV